MIKALVVVDVQVCMFFGDWPLPDAKDLLSRIGNRILRARSNGTEVIWVQNDGPADELDAPGMPYWQLALAPADGERVVRKKHQNVFESNPELAVELRSRGITELEFVGVQSELCLLSSAQAAKELGFRVHLERELHGTYAQEDETAAEISDRVQLAVEKVS